MAEEVEAKIRLGGCGELGRILERLRGLGAKCGGLAVEEDVYYQHPCRDFSETDEALRLRRVSGGGPGRLELTYKGPRRLLGGPKAREELSLELPEGAWGVVDAVLRRLGFRPAAVVRKRRRYCVLGDVVVSLDEVEELGCFVEIEYRGGGGASEAAARIEEAAEALGLAGAESVAESYLELLLARRGGGE